MRWLRLGLLQSKRNLSRPRPWDTAGYLLRGFAVSGNNDSKSDDRAQFGDIYANLFGSDDKRESGGAGAGVGMSTDAGGLNERQTTKNNANRFGIEHKTEKVDAVADDVPVRLWSDSFEIPEEMLTRRITFDDIPDWSPDVVSRISKERVRIFEGGIPTLSELSSMPLPPPAFPHPGHGTNSEYANLRKRTLYEYVREEVVRVAEPKIVSILRLPNWKEKQDAVDELFESVELELRGSMSVISSHTDFGSWVEKALEGHLKDVPMFGAYRGDGRDDSDGPGIAEDVPKTHGNPTEEKDLKALPTFMDCIDTNDPQDQMVPSILTPLKPHLNHGPGRMVEEWELSAHKATKRIMLRQSTRAVARALLDNQSARVLVTGRRGVGKSAAIASIVASARKSGHIVLYLPDGNRLHRHGYYILPNEKQKGIFDLPLLSQEVCGELLSSHESDLAGMETEANVMRENFTETQLETMTEFDGGKVSLVDLLKAAESNALNASGCFSVVVNYLIKQEAKPFLIVLDEFNCYFEPGHYYHMDYDFDVEKAIPYNQINLFKPALDAMALSIEEDEDMPLLVPVAPKLGGVVVGISESCAVARKVTESLCTYASRSALSSDDDVPLSIIDVPRFSQLEVDHIIANFESLGVGNLRGDTGDTVLNAQGIAYLRMVSGNNGQNLLDVCCC